MKSVLKEIIVYTFIYSELSALYSYIKEIGNEAMFTSMAFIFFVNHYIKLCSLFLFQCHVTDFYNAAFVLQNSHIRPL